MSKLRTVAAVGCMFILCSSLAAQVQQGLTRRDAQKLVTTATSPEEFAKLEVYYRSEAERYRALARREREEMLSEENTVSWEKGPRRRESAKQLWEYYRQIATQDEELAAKYKKAAPPLQ